MKKIFIISIFITFTLGMYSQNFNGGIIAGLNATQISGDQLGGYNKLGLNLGGYVNLSTGKNTSLQLELGFVQKGSRSEFGIGDSTLESRKIYRLRLNYIEMPIFFQYNLRGISKHANDSTFHLLNRLSVEVGLAYAVLLSSSEDDFTGNFVLYTPAFNKEDVSLMAGIYFKVNEHLRISFRRTGSIIPVRKHSGDATYRLNMGQYNDVVELTLHWQINKSNVK